MINLALNNILQDIMKLMCHFNGPLNVKIESLFSFLFSAEFKIVSKRLIKGAMMPALCKERNISHKYRSIKIRNYRSENIPPHCATRRNHAIFLSRAAEIRSKERKVGLCHFYPGKRLKGA
jgi:hypothetical protein